MTWIALKLFTAISSSQCLSGLGINKPQVSQLSSGVLPAEVFLAQTNRRWNQLTAGQPERIAGLRAGLRAAAILDPEVSLCGDYPAFPELRLIVCPRSAGFDEISRYFSLVVGLWMRNTARTDLDSTKSPAGLIVTLWPYRWLSLTISSSILALPRDTTPRHATSSHVETLSEDEV
ncbi:hypothetical protein RRG08_017391 [Elysia crispata]|uniref:Uncharacterized protein n=1 Tax=Elysia crispata TaxID=231223 RepID=A0AAE1DAH0_9GAST|nr:hypothetical protein RRG08_017391 [Elysia crispata]